jgi:hypothetical protein
MKRYFGLYVGLALMLTAGVTGQSVTPADRDATKKVLGTAIAELSPVVKGNKEAEAVLQSLKSPTDAELDRMTIEMKEQLEITQLDPKAVQDAQSEIKTAIQKEGRLSLLGFFKAPKSVPLLCWLHPKGCK